MSGTDFFLIRRVLDGNIEKTQEINEEILQHQLELSDRILCHESLELAELVPENWNMVPVSEKKEVERRVTRASTELSSALECRDFKKLLLEAFSASHLNLAKCKRYDFASPQFHILLKRSLAECWFLSGDMELSFDNDLEQYLVRVGAKTYYICKQGACSIGLLRSRQMCYKHNL